MGWEFGVVLGVWMCGCVCGVEWRDIERNQSLERSVGDDACGVEVR